MSTIQFNSEIAAQYGVNEAIMIYHFKYMLTYNKSHNHHYHDGRYWTYNSIKYFTENTYKFWTARQIEWIIKSLVKQNVILIGNYNKHKYDKTAWYAFVDEERFLGPKPLDSTHSTKMLNGFNNSSMPEKQAKSTLAEIFPSESRIPVHSTKMLNGFNTNVKPIPVTYNYYYNKKEEGPLALMSILENAPLPLEEEDPFPKKEKKAKRKPKTPLPLDWELPQEWYDWAIERKVSGKTIGEEAAKFKRYWTLLADDPSKREWFATWQNWICKHKEYAEIDFDEKKYKRPLKATIIKPIEIKQSDNPKIQQWNELQPVLKDKVGSSEYDSWLARLELISTDGKAVFKGSDGNKFLIDYVSTHFRGDLSAILLMIDPELGIEMNMEFII
jgi:hypothetical protein